jgi:hypothetical protein
MSFEEAESVLSGFTDDELLQLEGHDKMYADMMTAYEFLIKNEIDEHRIEILHDLVAGLIEDNK